MLEKPSEVLKDNTPGPKREKKKKLLVKTEDARINVLASISMVGHIKATKKYSLMFLALTFLIV